MTALIDTFRRPITYLRVSVTDKCNLRCVYCMPEGGLPWLRREEILSYEEIAAVVAAAARAGVRSIRLTGGEPLLRRDLHRLVAAIAAIEGIDDIALSTNGLLLEEQIATLASAGLRRINLSLDTLRPDRFEAIARRPGLDAVLRGLNAAIAAGMTPMKLNCVVMRGKNDDELADFAALTRDLPLYVRFIEVMPVHENLGLQKDAYVASSEVLERLGAIDDLQPVEGPPGNGPARYFAFPTPPAPLASSALSRTITATVAIACASPRMAVCASVFLAITRSICGRRCAPEPVPKRWPTSFTPGCSSSRRGTICAWGRRPPACGPSRKSAVERPDVTAERRRPFSVHGRLHRGGPRRDRAAAHRNAGERASNEAGALPATHGGRCRRCARPFARRFFLGVPHAASRPDARSARRLALPGRNQCGDLPHGAGTCSARRAGSTGRVLLLGHNPGLAELAVGIAQMTDGPAAKPLERARAKFPTAAVAVLEFTGELHGALNTPRLLGPPRSHALRGL